MNEVDRRDSWITFSDLAAPLKRRWRSVAAAVLGAMVLAGAVRLGLPRPFEATAVLATVGGSPSLGALGSLAGAAAAIGGVSMAKGDLTPTPELVTALLMSRRVLTAVGQATLSGNSTLIQSMVGEPVPVADIPRVMRRWVRTEIGGQTGLVTVRVRHRDSSLARRATVEIVEQMTRSFVDAARSQARGIRLAQEARLDSAGRQLARAELTYRDFLRANRVVGEFSVQSVERDRLARELEVARQVFLQATSDREAAVARELQDTPAVVVIDPAPAELPRRPRQLVVTMLLAGAAGLLVGMLGVYLTETGSRGPAHG